MFKALEQNGEFLGYQLERPPLLFVFGSRHLSKEKLPSIFPNFKFCFLRQVHGHKVVLANPEDNSEADAHFTSKTNWALVSQTADCVPILLAGQKSVCAVHAGWRGVAQDILCATRSVFANDPVQFAAIGPHILWPSFEVGRDVAEQLLRAAPVSQNPSVFMKDHPDPAKTFFNLTELVRQQLRAHFGSQIEVFECLEDTTVNKELYSFRRERAQAGRQYSFVVLKS